MNVNNGTGRKMKPRALRVALPRETTLAFCVIVAPVDCDKRVMKSFSDALCALTEVRGATETAGVCQLLDMETAAA